VKASNLKKNSKVEQILIGAKNAFLELGYEGTSVDEISRRAGTSKATLYNYFSDKQALFISVVERECSQQEQIMSKIASEVGNFEDGLYQIAKNFIKFTVSPLAISIFRLVVAESQRFPLLSRTFYDSGPDQCIRRLAEYLAAATARGEISVSQPELAASQFFALCKAELFYKILFGLKTDVKDDTINRIADTAVQTFLQAYKSSQSENIKIEPED